MVWVAQESFATGEISPSVFGLVSSSQYRTGCQTLVNGLLTPTGAVKKRHGTNVIAPVTGSYPCRIFSYFAKGRQFVVQFVSEDDDSFDENSLKRQVRVLDAVTRQFINFGDGQPHGPFDPWGALSPGTPTAGQFHHFTASQLPNVYSFQDGDRIFFCHPDRPTLFMEREVFTGGLERWKYGLTPHYTTSPKVVDNQADATILSPTSIAIESNTALFTPSDIGTHWRVGGGAVEGFAAFPYGAWFRADKYLSRFAMQGIRYYGTPGTQAEDWTGPFVFNGVNDTVVGPLDSFNQNDVRTYTLQVLTFLRLNHIGTFITLDSIPHLIIGVQSTSAFTTVRLQGGPTIFGAGASFDLFDLGGINGPTDKQYLDGRRAVTPDALTGATNLYTIDAVIATASGNPEPWLPDGHETPFASSTIGGAFHINSGIVALNSLVQNVGPFADEPLYSGTAVTSLAHKGPSIQWGLGPSLGTGFASCGISHQGRVWYGGYESAPSTIVGSRVNRPEDFTPGSLDDDSIRLTISDPLGGRVTWMESAADLLVGTTTAEFSLGGRPITPTNFASERQTGYGSRSIRPVLVGSSAVFVDGGGHGLREMTFVDTEQRYQSPDLTDLAKHIFEDVTIAAIAYVTSPETILYVIDEDDRMYAFSYWRKNGVAGWSRFEQPAWPIDTDTAEEVSTIESMTVVRADGINILKDELWLVRRQKAGGMFGAGTAVRRIERMTPDFTMDQTHIDTSPADETSVDVSGTFLGDYSLEDDAQILIKENAADPLIYIGIHTGSGLSSFTIFNFGYVPAEGQVGRPIRFNLVPVTPHGPDNSGDTQGRLEKITTALILIRDSLGGTAGDGIKAGSLMPPGTVVPAFPNPSVVLTPLTGWRRVVSVGVKGSLARLEIVQTEPYHFEIAGINFQMTYGK